MPQLLPFKKFKSQLEQRALVRPQQAAEEALSALNDLSNLESIELLQSLVNVIPEYHQLWLELAQKLKKDGQFDAMQKASQQFELISRFNSELIIAQEAYKKGNLKSAEKGARALLQHIPNEVRALTLMALIAKQHNRLDIAVSAMKFCHEAKPKNIEIAEHYGRLLLDNKQPQIALQIAEHFLDIEPANIELLSCKALALVKTGQYRTAKSVYQQLTTLLPDNASCYLRFANVLKIIGETANAIDNYKHAISLQPSQGEGYWNLANLKTYRFSEDELSTMLELCQSLKDNQQLALLHFALGKAYEDKGEFDNSFKHYQIANSSIKPETTDNNNDKYSYIKNIYSKAFISQHLQTGNPTKAPIFIIGLPRSGSTLVEQVLASHSKVDGTMELTEIASIALELSRNAPDNQLSKQNIASLAQRYLKFVEPHRQGAEHFIDKLPANFQHIGLIKLLFPNATIIDVRREPMACGWSIYSQYFASGVEYAYDLKSIGLHYNQYRDLMSYWNDVFADEILTVSYEQLVNNFASTVEKILAHCNLKLEQSCLNFYDSQRAVATPSSEQVRKPIYQDALTHWQHYEPYLEPLKRVLKTTS